jgi:hypothetical protein
MTRLTKFCVATALVGLAVGLLVSFDVIEVGNHVAWYIALPVGAIFIGLSLACYALEKEMARFDEEHKSPPTRAKPQKTGPATTDQRRCDCHLPANSKSLP